MTWLLKLYPPGWRRRYGDELRALVESQPFSLSASIDLIAGAIDAWVEPQQGAKTMRFECAKAVSREDARKAAAVNIAGTLVLTAIWMILHFRFGDHTWVDSFSALAFLVPYLFSLHYTSLKGRPLRTQAIFIGTMTMIVTLILGTAGWIASTI